MISLIVAIARTGVIGHADSLIWHISEDLRRFKTITTGHPIVMGRKTYQSIGRPLPGRTNVVISRRNDFRPEGCIVVDSFDKAVSMFDPAENIFVIGGAQVYAQALPIADRLYVTEIEADYEGDTRFPDWDRSQWTLTDAEYFSCGEKFEHPFAFLDYVRKK